MGNRYNYVLRDKALLHAVVAALRSQGVGRSDSVEVDLTSKRMVVAGYPGACSDANYYCVAVYSVGHDGTVMRDYARGVW